MGFIGKQELGFVVRIKGGFVGAWRRGKVCSRLKASRSHRRVTACTPTRRGPTFVCARRRGLCSISGCLSLWDRQPSNAPPLLLSPAGLASRRGPHTKTRLGLCPKIPLPLNCGWIRTMLGIVCTALQIRSQGACSAFLCEVSANR